MGDNNIESSRRISDTLLANMVQTVTETHGDVKRVAGLVEGLTSQLSCLPCNRHASEIGELRGRLDTLDKQSEDAEQVVTTVKWKRVIAAIAAIATSIYGLFVSKGGK